MRALPFVAVVVGIGLLGAGAWFLSQDRGGSGAGLDPAAAPTAAAEPARGSGSPEADLVVPEASPDEPTGRAEVAALPDPTPAASPEPVSATPLTAVVLGRVVDPAGRAVSGARVVAGAPTGVIEIERSARKHAETRSDGSGAFELEVEPGNLELRVEAEGFVVARRKLGLEPKARRNLGDWELAPGVFLSGIVLDPQRRPVPEAEIRRRYSVDQPGLTIITSDGGPLVTTTDENGRFRIASQEAGEYSFLVVTEDFPSARFSGATEAPGDRVTDIEVLLEPGASIAGRVVDVPEEERGELLVRAQQIGGSASISGPDNVNVSGFSIGPDQRVARVDEDGSFELRGLRVATDYELTARAREGTWFLESSRTEPATARSGDQDVTLEYSPAAVIAFQAVDAISGEPITEFEAEAGTQWLQPLADANGRPLTRHPDGRARFDGLRPESPGERTELLVRAVGYEDYRVDGIALTLGQTEDLGVLRLKRIPVVLVTALDARGVPVAGADVSLTPLREPGNVETRSFRMRTRRSEDDGESETIVSDDDGSRTGRTDENGVCQLSSLPGKDCRLRVMAAGFAPYVVEGLSLPATEDYETTARLTTGGIVEVTVLDGDGSPVSGMRVEHRSQQAAASMGFGDFEPPRVSDVDGRVRFDHLEEGSHMFRLDESAQDSGTFAFVGAGDGHGEASTEGWEVVDVIGGETFTLSLVASPRSFLTGRVTEAGEPLAGAYVELEDPDDGSDPLGGAQIFGGSAGVKTDKTGAFEILDRKAGPYRLVISHPTRAMPTEYDVELFEGENRELIDLPVTSVAGRITDGEGKPIAGIEVQAKRYEGESGSGRQVVMMMTVSSSGDGGGSTMVTMGGPPPVTVMTDEEGRYLLRGVAPGMKVMVEGSSDDYQTAQSEPFVVEEGEGREHVDFSMLGAGRIAVQALRAGQPVGNQLVRANFVGDSAEPVAPKVAVLNGDGTAELTGLQVGAWSISVTPLAHNNSTAPVEQTVEVRAGETGEAIFELP